MGHVQVSHKPRPLTKVLFASLINELKFSLGLINVEGLHAVCSNNVQLVKVSQLEQFIWQTGPSQNSHSECAAANREPLLIVGLLL